MRLPRRVLVIAGAATVLLGAGTATVAANRAAGPVKNGVVNACYTTAAARNGSHSVLLENTGHKCPRGYSRVQWNQKGKTAPSGVVSMTHYAPDTAPAVPGFTWEFLGPPPIERFANGKTAAEVTATVDEGSLDGNLIGDIIGICYEPVGGSTVTNVARVQPAFAAAAGTFFAQTVSGVVGNLAAGDYHVGLCAEDQLNLQNGGASVTIILAQTASGVSIGIPG